MRVLKQIGKRQLKKVERLVKALTILKYRQATSGMRPLPDFIIMGAQKAGTTSLFHYLGQHPQLMPSLKKEVHYFDGGSNPNIDNYKKGPEWYRSNFPIRKESQSTSKTFEASPLYIFNPLVPERIADLVPQVKLIALLRNPTERAISHFFHEKRNGREPLSIMEAFQYEEERLRPVFDRNEYKNNVFIHCSYKSRGLYHEQIKRYLNYFPMENILTVNSEKLFTDPVGTLRRIFEFVGVDAEFIIRDLEPHNVGSNKSKVAPEVYEYLDEYFRPHNRQLYDLVGENYGW